jgi:CheY-like chemotaxis protein
MIYLPTTVAAQQEDQIKQPAHSKVGRLGRVLIMDDEQVIRDVAGELITAQGHEVEFAKHGEEAIELYKAALKEQQTFGVVILDLTIRGGMGGVETVQQLLKINHMLEPLSLAGTPMMPPRLTTKNKGSKLFSRNPMTLTISGKY